MTEQEKTFIAREFDKLENQLDSKHALYENGYQSALFDALEVVNKLPIHNVSQQREMLLAFLEFYHNPKFNTVNTTFSEDVDMFLANNCG